MVTVVYNSYAVTTCVMPISSSRMYKHLQHQKSQIMWSKWCFFSFRATTIIVRNFINVCKENLRPIRRTRDTYTHAKSMTLRVRAHHSYRCMLTCVKSARQIDSDVWHMREHFLILAILIAELCAFSARGLYDRREIDLSHLSSKRRGQ